MTYLEIALIAAEVVTLAALVRSYRKHMILRHLFIRFSDWTASKIDELAESASWEIIERQKTAALEHGHTITDDEARRWVPDVIIYAKDEWQDQADHFQATLKRNGMSPLGSFDLDAPVFNPKLSGFKSLPLPQSRTLMAMRDVKPPAG